jgi:hypothetical protein
MSNTLQRSLRTAALLCVAACLALGAPIDGAWSGQITTKPKNAAADWKAPEFSLELKAEGDKLTGTVTPKNAKGKGRSLAIVDGKVNADGSFTFVTVQKGKDGENRQLWNGAVKGDEITGTRGKEGAKRAPSFSAKRGG